LRNLTGRHFYHLDEQYQRQRQVFKIENVREPRLSDTDPLKLSFIAGELDHDNGFGEAAVSLAFDPTRMKQPQTMSVKGWRNRSAFDQIQ